MCATRMNGFGRMGELNCGVEEDAYAQQLQMGVKGLWQVGVVISVG